MIKKYQDFINRRTKKCPCCESPIRHSTIRTPLLSLKQVLGKDDRSFYGGNVVRFSHSSCPVCKTELLIYLKACSGGYMVHDVAVTDQGVEMFNATRDSLKLQDYNETEGKGHKEGQNGSMGSEDSDKGPDASIKPVTRQDLDERHMEHLVRAVNEGDIANAVASIKNMVQLFNIPKALEATEIKNTDIYSNSGKAKKADEYIKLVTEFINKKNKDE